MSLFKIIAAVIVLNLLFSIEPAAHSTEMRCNTGNIKNANIIVYSPNIKDAKLGCLGALSAVRFLSDLGVETQEKIELRIVDKLPAASNSSALGYYNCRLRCAYLLSFSEANKKGTPFGIPLDPFLYISLAAHEVAHIVIARNFTISQPHIEAREYIAYVAMFAVMPANLRDRLLKKVPEPAFETEADIVALAYLSNPPRFGVKAYKHFSGLKDKRAFIQQVLAGRALSTDIFY